jgi:hypothetical protein
LITWTWVTDTDTACGHAWTGSWTGAQDNPSAASAISAITQGIVAARAPGAPSRASCKRQASGSNPLTGSQVRWVTTFCVSRFVERMTLAGSMRAVTPEVT